MSHACFTDYLHLQLCLQDCHYIEDDTFHQEKFQILKGISSNRMIFSKKIYTNLLDFDSSHRHTLIMGKESLCPGCKHRFQNGQPYSLHIKSCKEIEFAVNQALKKHWILTMKKVEEKKVATAAHRELASQASQALPDDQMNVDRGREVFFYPFIFFYFILCLHRIF